MNANLVFFRQSMDFFFESNACVRRAIALESLKEDRATVDESIPSEITHEEARCRTGASVQLTNICFSYENASAPVFDGFNFVAEPGEQVAIVGPSGVGKSTLLAIITGAERPQRGVAAINGVPARKAIHEGRFRAAYVGPEPFLFEASLRENLLYGITRKVPDAEIAEVLRSLGMMPAEAGMEQEQLSSRVQSLGSNYSTGQKQRLCFARAILTKPDLLVLDEVTANLDAEAKFRIVEWLTQLKKECTVLIVTHNRDLLQHADRIYDLGNTPSAQPAESLQIAEN